MPRREKDRELARRRKRAKERRKLRAKGLLTTPPEGMKVGAVREAGKKKAEKAAPKEATPKETPPVEAKEASDAATTEGQS